MPHTKEHEKAKQKIVAILARMLVIAPESVKLDARYDELFNQDPEAVMTFTAVGDNNTCIWGSMAGEENGEMFTSMAAESLKKVILDTAKANGTLPAEFMDCSIEWKSADESVITADGEILAPAEKVKVDLTAVITFGDSVREETYHVTVKP
jgi:hypothetical protein